MKYLSHNNSYEISYIQFEPHFENTRTAMQSKELNKSKSILLTLKLSS